MCVQHFDDSRGLAIRITYRISLRSSSLWEPRYPLLNVVGTWVFRGRATIKLPPAFTLQVLFSIKMVKKMVYSSRLWRPPPC